MREGSKIKLNRHQKRHFSSSYHSGITGAPRTFSETDYMVHATKQKQKHETKLNPCYYTLRTTI